MKQKEVKLPSLSRPLLSSRIASIQDYKHWDDTRKRAYRAELDRQIEEHRRCRQLRKEQKSIERVNMSAMAEQEQNKLVIGKYAKIKTQQKYQQDNFRLMDKSKEKKRSRQWYTEQKQHPFVKLVEEEQRRKNSTKKSFIYQNKLNDIQTEMKRSMRLMEKKESVAESQKYVNFVEGEFQKHQKQRKDFENKYLKVDKGSSQSFKKQYLEYLKQQAQIYRKSNSKKQQTKDNQKKMSDIFGIGDVPVTFDRRKQLQIIEKSLRDFSGSKSITISPQLSQKKQYQMTIATIAEPRLPNYQKVVTQRAALGEKQQVVRVGTERAHSSLSNSQNLIKYREIRDNPEQKQKRQFRHFDIINNSSKLFFA